MDLLLIRKASGSQKSQACTRQGSLLGKLQTRSLIPTCRLAIYPLPGVLLKPDISFSKSKTKQGLDALGDLRLGGVLSGRYESLRPGHSLNIMLLKKLYSSAKNFRFV
mmetsp:Transcript_16779/g.68626  ORF Transcript_16779/g.68626 Transcript_16779/m.68626 type:complete len:108 (-) Transcript_16779:110-433(-)